MAIDALAGRQTREHGDVDIDFDATRENELIAALEMLGYQEVLDERPTRIELVAADGWCVDLHPLQLDASGDARQQAPDGSWWHFRREWFTTGYIENRLVPCFTADGQLYFHSGYELRDVDVRDMASRCSRGSRRLTPWTGRSTVVIDGSTQSNRSSGSRPVK